MPPRKTKAPPRVEAGRILPGQIQRIHGLIRTTLPGEAEERDAIYRQMLMLYFKVGSCKSLSTQQAALLIGHLEGRISAERMQRAQAHSHASADAIRMMRYYAIQCAIHYAPLGPVADRQTGEILQGADARKYLQSLWDAGKRGPQPEEAQIPGEILRHLWSNWINPKSNGWLTDRGFRRAARNATTLYYDQASGEEIAHLIDRYRAMYQTIMQSTVPQTNITRSVEQWRK